MAVPSSRSPHGAVAHQAPRRLMLTALAGLPAVQAGADLAQLVSDAIARAGITVRAGDAFVVSQKIVSKSENRWVRLRDVTPSARAHAHSLRLLAKTRGW